MNETLHFQLALMNLTHSLYLSLLFLDQECHLILFDVQLMIRDNLVDNLEFE